MLIKFYFRSLSPFSGSECDLTSFLHHVQKNAITQILLDFQTFSKSHKKLLHFSGTILRTFFELTKFSQKILSFFDFCLSNPSLINYIRCGHLPRPGEMSCLNRRYHPRGATSSGIGKMRPRDSRRMCRCRTCRKRSASASRPRKVVWLLPFIG